MLHKFQTLLYHNNHLFICLFVYLCLAPPKSGVTNKSHPLLSRKRL